MFTIDHVNTMANFFVGLCDLLDSGSARDIEILSRILREYGDQPHERHPEMFPGIVMEIGALYADAASNVDPTEAVEYKALFREEARFDLALLAANYSRQFTEEQCNFLFLALMDAKKKLQAGEEEKAEAAAKPIRKAFEKTTKILKEASAEHDRIAKKSKRSRGRKAPVAIDTKRKRTTA